MLLDNYTLLQTYYYQLLRNYYYSLHCYFLITTSLLRHIYVIITYGKSSTDWTIITYYAMSMCPLLLDYYTLLRHHYQGVHFRLTKLQMSGRPRRPAQARAGSDGATSPPAGGWERQHRSARPGRGWPDMNAHNTRTARREREGGGCSESDHLLSQRVLSTGPPATTTPIS